MKSALLGGRRAHELLWANRRLVTLDIETVWETGTSLPDEAEAETAAAIAQVQATGAPVGLRPRNRRTRFFQHQRAEAAGLTSASTGEEPNRAVEIRPGIAGVPAPAEPVATHEGRHRVVSIAFVEVVRGQVSAKPWHSLVNAGVPVDPGTFEIHGLTDAKLRSAPPFERVAPEILDALTAKDGETLVLVAHYAPFDVGVLRTEFGLLGHDFPDVALLDTQGPLAREVGAHPADGKLRSLLAALRITNAAEHSATGDATATAAAVVELIRLASERGVASVPELLALAGGRRTGAIGGAPGRIRPARTPGAFVSPEHLERHTVLPEKPTKAELAAWVKVADDCAAHRCPDLALSFDSLVRTTPAAPGVLLDTLAAALARRVKANDGPGANTIVGAIAVVFERFCPMPAPPSFSGTYPIRRKETIASYHAVTWAVAGLAPCRPFAECAWCRSGEPCPRYELARALASGTLDPKWDAGRLTRESTMLAWIRADEAGGWFFHRQDPATRGVTPAGPVLADAALVALLRGYAAYGEESDRASQIREQLVRFIGLGCGDPALVEMWAEVQATGGRPEDLAAAIAVCDEALERAPKARDSAWASLDLARNHLAGRLGRIAERKRIKEDGTTEIVVPHTPGAKARRKTELRFARG